MRRLVHHESDKHHHTQEMRNPGPTRLEGTPALLKGEKIGYSHGSGLALSAWPVRAEKSWGIPGHLGRNGRVTR